MTAATVKCRRGAAHAGLATMVWFLLAMAIHTPVAYANRFGPPWQAQVTAAQTVALTEPDPASSPVGPLGKGAILAVFGASKDAQGTEWAATQVGFVRAADLTEKDDPWIAEVTSAHASVYAKPNAQDVIRRQVEQGDLLRVAGLSPGLNGDSNVWWATTEGYVLLDALQPSFNTWAVNWTMPDPSLAEHGWWTTIQTSANVRAGPTTESPVLGQLGAGSHVKVLREQEGEFVLGSATWAYIDGGRFAGAWVHSSLMRRMPDPEPTMTAPPTGDPTATWIVVDRTRRTLTLFEAGRPTLTTYVALGVAGRDTPSGTYTTWGKYRVDDMTSTSVPDPGGYYDLPNVPDTQYYKAGGYAIHGTYWHDAFATDQSHGCINVTSTDGAFLFDRTLPAVPTDQITVAGVRASTPVVILP
ncbi:MAG: L,D-transpeptidase family protein [Chloroflexota bacterium]|nr:L,D-transpeptidase family protein [Chloroflexota bacterium]